MPIVSERHRSLSFKLTIGIVGLVVLAVSVLGSTIYYIQSEQLRADARTELAQAVNGLKQMIFQSIEHTIRAQLQSTADRNRQIVAMIYEQHKRGDFGEDDAKQLVRDILLSQRIGVSGYLYVLDSTGTLRVHPKLELVDVDISRHGFVKEQIARKTGYLEYEWQNPGEPRPRPKALAMSYFEPWDYIISASAYREEFASMVDLGDFRDDVLALKFHGKGYAYIMDTKGTVLIHPEMEGTNVYDARDAAGRDFIAEMCRQKSGYISYPWKNPGEERARYKDVVFNYFPPLDIIIAGGIYQEDLYAPLEALRVRLFIVFAVVLALSILAAFLGSRALSRPVVKLSELADRIAGRDLRVVDEFDQMTAAEQQGRTWIGRGSMEILVLLRAFRQAGASIRELLAILGAKSKKLDNQQSLIETAAAFSSKQVSEQSTMVGRVSAAVSELTTAFDATRQMTRAMHTLATEAVVKVTDGRAATVEATEVMKQIWSSSETTQQEILKLGEMTERIEGMLQMVQEFSRHSQLLSVNARIQAAKAGAAGRGFLVVAAEVRDLALQSATSTARIRATLRDIRESAMDAIVATAESTDAVARGQESVTKLVGVIDALNQTIERNSKTALQISEIVSKQSATISRISSEVVRVERNSLAGTKTAESLMQAVEELHRTQAELADLVVQYRV